MPVLAVEDKRARVSQVPLWWHSIDLGDGIVTPGVISPDVHAICAAPIPDRLDGKRVLDIGAFDGFYSFLCEKRGARVLAIDNEENELGGRGFRTAREILDAQVEYRQMDLFDLDPEADAFDIVLFFGVLYHLKNPLGALDLLSAVTQERLLLESHYIVSKNEDVPLMRFYPGRELNKDATNWWGPNIRCILDMLEVAGFREVRVVATFGLVRPDRPWLRLRLSRRRRQRHRMRQSYGRVLIEALK